MYEKNAKIRGTAKLFSGRKSFEASIWPNKSDDQLPIPLFFVDLVLFRYLFLKFRTNDYIL